MHLKKSVFLQLTFSVIGLILVVGMVTFYNFNRGSIDDELRNLYLLPRPEKLTELYFNNNANLPSSVPSDGVISFSFVIHNLETIDYQYVYTVSTNTNDTRQIVDSGKVLVCNEQLFVKHEELNLVKSAERQQIVVELTNKQQSIYFWINNGQ